MLDDPLGYFGIDWLAMILTFIAIWQLGNKNRMGFIIMICGNVCWITIGIMADSLAMVVANIIFSLLNVRALLKWKGEKIDVQEL